MQVSGRFDGCKGLLYLRQRQVQDVGQALDGNGLFPAQFQDLDEDTQGQGIDRIVTDDAHWHLDEVFGR